MEEALKKRRQVDYNSYWSYHNMISRCYKEYDKKFPHYGGRGIKVCDRWLEGFHNFFEDMGEKPSPDHSLDRIDTNGDYYPENCRWATREEQQNNRRDNVIVSFNGKEQTLAQWSRETGVSAKLLRVRHKNGCSIEKLFQPAFSEKMNPKQLWEFEGKAQTFAEWTKELKLCRVGTLKRKMNSLGSFELAVLFFKERKRTVDWSKCYVCGNFIPFKDYKTGAAIKNKISENPPVYKNLCRTHTKIT